MKYSNLYLRSLETNTHWWGVFNASLDLFTAAGTTALTSASAVINGIWSYTPGIAIVGDH